MKNKELREMIYKYNRITLPEDGINDKMLLKLEKLFTSQREDIKRKIAVMRKRVNKRIKEVSTDEKRYPIGYNRAIDDILKLL